MVDENKYKYFSESDFIADVYFQDWVINATSEHDLFWKNFFEANPDKREAGETARHFLINLKFNANLPDEQLVERSFVKHLADLEELKDSKVVSISPKFNFKALIRIAAVFGGILLIISALLIFNKNDKPVLVKTEYGNIKSVVLPDSSLVVLNANSTIKFGNKWGKSNSREVWLQGEAFFNIRHINQDTNEIKQNEQFIVHTDDLTIEVLGTSFDIRQRRGKTEVVLETGRIKVSFTDKEMNDIIMKPGDILAYHPGKDKPTIATTSAEDFSAWKEKKLILNDPTAAEIVEYLEDNFGKDIILENAELGKRKIEGPILLTNLDDALFILSTVLNTEIIKKDSTIIIRPR